MMCAAPPYSASPSSAAGPPRRVNRCGRCASPRARGQTIVEFGLVVLLFVLLISGMFDFGLSLNARLSISSLSRILARAAAEGATDGELTALANGQGHIIGVSTDTFGGYCCGSGDAIVVKKTYCSQIDVTGCTAPSGTARPGDRIVVNVTANGLEVFTPLARPVFGCSGSQPHCWTPISAQTTMRVEPTPTPGP